MIYRIGIPIDMSYGLSSKYAEFVRIFGDFLVERQLSEGILVKMIEALIIPKKENNLLDYKINSRSLEGEIWVV